ncbi:MAG: hypothetical protein CBC01_08330 [Betaproteobacteria bacterium TMED41]|nr:MAG: hypothetical protein CBC01_08330 [Betaproteobacteria bacterium TMED41]
MTVRTPLVYNGSQLQEMKASDLANIYKVAAYYYGQSPAVTLTVAGSGGNLTSMNDTRLQAGAVSTSSGGYPSEGTTAEPSTVTTSYQRITQTVGTANITTSDTGKTFPIYWTGTQVRAMTQQDFIDTFVQPTIDVMALGSTTSAQGGTYFISTSSSVAGATLVSATPVFTDTRADTSLYTADQIGEALDQPQTITNYYLLKIDGEIGTGGSYNPPIFLDASNNLKQYSTADIGALLQEYVKNAVVNTAGYRLRYNIDGSGTLRGSAMVNTVLTGGSGNYQTRLVGSNDYRAQEFPDGTPATANTYSFKIAKS